MLSIRGRAVVDVTSNGTSNNATRTDEENFVVIERLRLITSARERFR
jgi:hypothetical protein